MIEFKWDWKRVSECAPSYVVKYIHVSCYQTKRIRCVAKKKSFADNQMSQ